LKSHMSGGRREKGYIKRGKVAAPGKGERRKLKNVEN